MRNTVDVAIVGGGPAGAALAIRLARQGITTALVERRAVPTWRASGVFASPLARGHLAELGLSGAVIADLNRPIAALNLETTRGVRCRIDYHAAPACGFDRLALESALLERARDAGAWVMNATVVRRVELADGTAALSRLAVSGIGEGNSSSLAPPRALEARVVVGADGASSLVSRAAGVAGTRSRFQRAGITFHRPDPAAAVEGVPMDGRFVFGDGWYVGIAPVPRGRVNVGMVVPSLRGSRPSEAADRLLASIPGAPDTWMAEPTTDHLAVAGRLEHHALRAGGRSWLLVGDAIGFLDPLTGEGLLRAFASARLAAEAIERGLRGDARAFEDYDRRIRRTFNGKNLVSWMLQLFLAQPAVLDYALRRLSRRDSLREELTLVLTDQARASRVVNPAYLGRLLAP